MSIYALNSPFPRKASKPIGDNTLDFLRGYHKTLIIRIICFHKVTLRGLHPFQLAAMVQAIFKTRWLCHNLFHVCYFTWEPPCLLLKIKYGYTFDGLGNQKGENSLGKENGMPCTLHLSMGRPWSALADCTSRFLWRFFFLIFMKFRIAFRLGIVFGIFLGYFSSKKGWSRP